MDLVKHNLSIFAATLLGGIIVGLLTDELKAWLIRFAELLMLNAIRHLPEQERDRYAEEWAASLADVPGSLSKLVFAMDLHRATICINQLQQKQIAIPSDRTRSKSADPKRTEKAMVAILQFQKGQHRTAAQGSSHVRSREYLDTLRRLLEKRKL